MLRNLGFGEIALILLIILVLFGATKLPQLGKAVGETMKEFRKGVKGDEPGSDDKKA
ncbi:MAG TPA: twin-arginine translocase TatA/TatE family subunit [Symbiobacteriaceae bacterium]|jgi:sec-independent protein translocase protein TatA